MTVWFWTAFGATVAALLAALVTGFRGRRRAHYAAVVLFVILLTVTIFLTEALMRAVEFPRAELDFHLVFAKSATALLLPVILTGVGLARARRPVVANRWRVGHRIAIGVFVLAVLSATGTGIWVFSLAT